MKGTPRFWRSSLAGLGLLGLLITTSHTVGARSYSLDRVVVDARVDRDRSLWIDETRTYTFDGRCSWADFRLPLDRVGSVSEFSLSEGDRAFAPGTDEVPGTYQLDASNDELYVRWHYVAEDETRSFKLRYRISDAVTWHPDVAELYFQFVGEINPQPIGGVEVNLALPEPAVFGDVCGPGRTDRCTARSTFGIPVGCRLPCRRYRQRRCGRLGSRFPRAGWRATGRRSPGILRFPASWTRRTLGPVTRMPNGFALSRRCRSVRRVTAWRVTSAGPWLGSDY